MMKETAENTTPGVTVVGLEGATAVLEGVDRGYTLKVSLAQDTSAMEAGCQRSFRASMPENMVVYELALTDGSGIPLTKLGYQSLMVAIPIPESLKGQSLKMITLDRNGQPESVAVERVMIGGVEAFCFETNHMSLFGVYGAGTATESEELMELTVEMNSMSAAPGGVALTEANHPGIPIWQRKMESSMC